jgi:flagellar assembly factor FliW
MPHVQTEQFGELEYSEESALLFARGLPGFEGARRFVLLDDAELPLWSICKVWKQAAYAF